jgi:hypothetical protein
MSISRAKGLILRTVLFWVVTQPVVPTFGDNLPVPSSGFKNLKDSETSARNSHYSLRYDPEERCFHLLGGGSLKARLLILFFKESNRHINTFTYMRFSQPAR